jgi:hypothetical protein
MWGDSAAKTTADSAITEGVMQESRSSNRSTICHSYLAETSKSVH